MRAAWVIIFFIFSSCFINQAAAKHKSHRPHRVAQAIYGSQDLTAEINRILYEVPSKTSVGIAVKSMKYGDTLYTKNAQHAFVPASIMKVLTAEAALIYLGPDYRFQTRLLTDAKSFGNGIVDGNVYLVHSGDPTLTYTDFLDLMSALKALNIQQINGNVYIDNSVYDQDNYGPGWDSKDSKYCYAAPINASIINHNCLNFKIVPAKSSGYLAEIITFSKYFYPAINNQVTTKSRGGRTCSIQLDNTENGINLNGCIGKGRSERGATTVIGNVMQYNLSLVSSLFQQNNIRIMGSVREGVAPNNVSVLASHQSEPLQSLVTEMLKKSDNVIAGSLFKKLGALYTKTPGSWKNGGIAVAGILSRKANVNTYHLSVIDGSGLSRFNQISPQQMMQTLDFAYHHSGTNYAFISALPIAGVDGTLKRRLYNLSGKVHAKTGTMSGVAALAGFVVSKDKEPLAFVIIFNGKKSMGWAYRSVEDKIVTALARYSR